MADPAFNITIVGHSKDTRVSVNGEDITRSIRRIRIEQEADGLPTVHLELTGVAAAVHVDAALRREDVSVKVQTVDVTPLGTEFEATTVLP